MTDAYINGFCKKAEEMGVDPEELLKVAFPVGGAIKAIRGGAKMLSKAPQILQGLKSSPVVPKGLKVQHLGKAYLSGLGIGVGTGALFGGPETRKQIGDVARRIGNTGKAAWTAAKNTPKQTIPGASPLMDVAATAGTAIRNAGRAAASYFYRDRTGGRSLGADLRGAGNAFTSGFKRNFTPGIGMLDRGLVGGVQGVKNYFTGK